MYLLHMLWCNYDSRCLSLLRRHSLLFMIKHFLSSETRGEVKMNIKRKAKNKTHNIVNVHKFSCSKRQGKTKWKNRSSFKLNRSFIIIFLCGMFCFNVMWTSASIFHNHPSDLLPFSLRLLILIERKNLMTLRSLKAFRAGKAKNRRTNF